MNNKFEGFYARLKEEYEDYIHDLEGCTPFELVEKAEEISDIQQVYQHLSDKTAIDSDYLEYIAEFNQPLRTVYAYYAGNKPSIYETLRGTLWDMCDKELGEEDLYSPDMGVNLC